MTAKQKIKNFLDQEPGAAIELAAAIHALTVTWIAYGKENGHEMAPFEKEEIMSVLFPRVSVGSKHLHCHCWNCNMPVEDGRELYFVGDRYAVVNEVRRLLLAACNLPAGDRLQELEVGYDISAPPYCDRCGFAQGTVTLVGTKDVLKEECKRLESIAVVITGI